MTLQVVKGLLDAAERCGAQFHYNCAAAGIETAGGRVTGVRLTDGSHLPADIVVSNRYWPSVPVFSGLWPELSRTLDDLFHICSANSFIGVAKSVDDTGPGSVMQAVRHVGGDVFCLQTAAERVGFVLGRDLPASYALLEGEAGEYGAQRHGRLAAMQYSAGVISYCWAVRRRAPALLHHNVFLSGAQLLASD